MGDVDISVVSVSGVSRKRKSAVAQRKTLMELSVSAGVSFVSSRESEARKEEERSDGRLMVLVVVHRLGSIMMVWSPIRPTRLVDDEFSFASTQVQQPRGGREESRAAQSPYYAPYTRYAAAAAFPSSASSPDDPTRSGTVASTYDRVFFGMSHSRNSGARVLLRLPRESYPQHSTLRIFCAKPSFCSGCCCCACCCWA